MNSNNPPPIDPKSQVCVLVNLAGRLMIASLEEFACKIIDMSPSAMHVYCVGFRNIGERIIAYIDHIGRVEGTVATFADHGFIVALSVTDRKREKLAAQLTWLANQTEYKLPEVACCRFRGH